MFSKSTKTDSLKEIISYSYPKLHTGKEWYIGFNAFDPASGTMKRKKIKINHIEKITERRRFASGLIYRLSQKLENGWNPWIESENSNAYHTFKEVCDNYRNYLIKRYNDDNLRLATMRSYISRLNMLEKWNKSREVPITYIYQFDRLFISKFLDYIYIELDNTVCTHNHYLVWLGNFSSYLTEKMYLSTKPTEGMQTIRKSKSTPSKTRKNLKEADIIRLRDYLTDRNKSFLLACYLLYYTMIRPREMSFLRIQYIHLKKQTIFVPGEISKNRKDAVVTLPAKVIHLMLDLQIFDYPGDYYLFSKDFKPGTQYRSPKHFGDYWVRYVKEKLKFPKTYQFYSLKGTGITNMLHNCKDVLSVRDQARHSDISTTNIYAEKEEEDANEKLVHYNDIL